ncbi:hypothetical protein M885DRAFT_487284 [Pelagophyceae sp. CCMP2097]|nr:hypothetical protein M885DRAFT_487284 [Pelagophyceae sp. CCMP2097]
MLKAQLETPMEEWLGQWPAVLSQQKALVAALYRREVRGSFACALQTVALLRKLVGTCHWATAGELIRRLRQVGEALVNAQPLELAVGNMIRRVLMIVREDHARLVRQRADEAPTDVSLQPSLSDVLTGSSESRLKSLEMPQAELRQNVMEQIVELYDEVEGVREPISAQALQHVHSHDVIMTLGNSRSVRDFIKKAASVKGRRFEVFVTETAPSFEGHAFANELAKACGSSVTITIIPESAVFALMTRVHKVILPTHAVMANGALLTHAGGHQMALAAREHAKPVLCVTGLFKLCPVHPHDADAFNDLTSPAAILPYAEVPHDATRDASTFSQLDVANPAYDNIPPDLVDLYVTNTGAHQPSYIYRLLAEFYSPEDTDAF